MDVANCLNDVWFRLGFLSQSDLNAATWISAADLYQYADEAVKRLAFSLGIFKEWDSAAAVSAGFPRVTLPAGHVLTVFAYLVSAGDVQLLRLTNVEQLFALDAKWSMTIGPPKRLSIDMGAATLYPSPVANGTLSQVFQKTPATVQSGASTLAVSDAARDYFTYAVLQTALSRESDHQRPEVAAHCLERMKLYEAAFAAYWGPGE